MVNIHNTMKMALYLLIFIIRMVNTMVFTPGLQKTDCVSKQNMLMVNLYTIIVLYQIMMDIAAK